MFFDAKTVILLGGATASGKSAVAMELAVALDAEIVNADSIQLYKDLPILTASPSISDQEGINHHLYSILDWDQTSSVMDWLNSFGHCLESTYTTNVFITTGGTGLYLSSLLYGLSPIPEISEDIRTYVRQQGKSIMNSSGSEALYDCIVKKDPYIKGRIHPHHMHRLLRAWEVFEQTGRSIVLWQKEPRLKNEYPKSQLFVLDIDRETLVKRIKVRCCEMIKKGVIDEIKAFVEKTKGVYSPLHRAIGFFEFKYYLEGKYTLDQAISLIVSATSQYAKRQQTWFRTQYKAEDVFLLPHDTPQSQASMIIKHLYTVNSEF